MVVREIDALRVRLQVVDGVADTFAVGWDTFELVQGMADDYADRTPDMFAAFMFAAASAAEGRDAVGFAPSMPTTPGIAVAHAGSDGGDALEIADKVAGLVSALGARLQAVAGQAEDPGDRRACEHAAGEAARICALLAPDRQ
jgi:hypothetical protein